MDVLNIKSHQVVWYLLNINWNYIFDPQILKCQILRKVDELVLSWLDIFVEELSILYNHIYISKYLVLLQIKFWKSPYASDV